MSAPTLAPDLERALERLKLARIRAVAPEVLQRAKVQRPTPRSCSGPRSRRGAPPATTPA